MPEIRDFCINRCGNFLPAYEPGFCDQHRHLAGQGDLTNKGYQARTPVAQARSNTDDPTGASVRTDRSNSPGQGGTGPPPQQQKSSTCGPTNPPPGQLGGAPSPSAGGTVLPPGSSTLFGAAPGGAMSTVGGSILPSHSAKSAGAPGQAQGSRPSIMPQERTTSQSDSGSASMPSYQSSYSSLASQGSDQQYPQYGGSVAHRPTTQGTALGAPISGQTSGSQQRSTGGGLPSFRTTFGDPSDATPLAEPPPPLAQSQPPLVQWPRGLPPPPQRQQPMQYVRATAQDVGNFKQRPQPNPVAQQLGSCGWYEPELWAYWRSNVPSIKNTFVGNWPDRLEAAELSNNDWPFPLPYENLNDFVNRQFRHHRGRDQLNDMRGQFNWREQNDPNLKAYDRPEAARDARARKRARQGGNPGPGALGAPNFPGGHGGGPPPPPPPPGAAGAFIQAGGYGGGRGGRA